MSALEADIVEKFRQLDDAGKVRVLAVLEREIQPAQADLATWLEGAAALRSKLREHYGKDHFFGVQTLLDDIREDASWPRW